MNHLFSSTSDTHHLKLDLSRLEKFYFDYFATTPCDPRVSRAILQSLCEQIGNPSSSHVFGWDARQSIEKARLLLSKVLDVRPKTITFTSGATESNQLALFGLAKHFQQGHIITQNTEHKAILDALPMLAKQGIRSTVLEVDALGHISLEQLEKAIEKDTFLVSIMHVNNEIGVIHPIEEIAKICQKHQILFHSDGSQAVGKLSFSLDQIGVDLYSFSAHKFYGPKGIGGLYIRKKDPEIQIQPMLYGGGQENGMRPGTLATHQIVGMGQAAQLIIDEFHSEELRIRGLRDGLYEALIQKCPEIKINGSMDHRVAGILNFRAPERFANLIDDRLVTFAYSRSSACSSGMDKGSHVLLALGLSAEQAHHSFRFGIGRMSSQEGIDFLMAQLR
jgi:cysteine desulfurase